MTSKSASPRPNEPKAGAPAIADPPHIAPLFSEVHIAARIDGLAAEIAADAPAPGGDALVLIGVLRGAIPFVADLSRALARRGVPLVIDFVSAASYSGRATTGGVIIAELPREPLAGRDVLVVDDILDTGLTLAAILGSLARTAPRRLRSCVLLDKKAQRRTELAADHVGFDCPDRFVVGYGMDLDGRFRELPFIGTVDPP